MQKTAPALFPKTTGAGFEQPGRGDPVFLGVNPDGVLSSFGDVNGDAVFQEAHLLEFFGFFEWRRRELEIPGQSLPPVAIQAEVLVVGQRTSRVAVVRNRSA